MWAHGRRGSEDSAPVVAVDANETAPLAAVDANDANETAQGDGRQDALGAGMVANARNLTLRNIKSWFVDDAIR